MSCAVLWTLAFSEFTRSSPIAGEGRSEADSSQRTHTSNNYSGNYITVAAPAARRTPSPAIVAARRSFFATSRFLPSLNLCTAYYTRQAVRPLNKTRPACLGKNPKNREDSLRQRGSACSVLVAELSAPGTVAGGARGPFGAQ